MWLADSNKVVGSGGAHSRRNSLVGGVRSSELGGDLFQHHIPPQQNQVLLTSNLNLGGSVENLASSFDMLPTQAADLYSFLDPYSFKDRNASPKGNCRDCGGNAQQGCSWTSTSLQQ